MTATQELQIYALWGGKQTAQGTPNTAPAHRFKFNGAHLELARTDGSIPYSDATEFIDKNDWVDTISGTGTPGIYSTPEELGWLLWAFHGGETVTTVTGPPEKKKHKTVPLPGLGFWLSMVQLRGSTVVSRYSFNDCQISQIAVEGSTANKAVMITPTILSLDPSEAIASNPAATMPTKEPFLYTDGASTFKMDGTAFRGHSQFTLTFSKDLQPQYGDEEDIYSLSIGTPLATVGVTLAFDTQTKEKWNLLVYGTATPAPGASPLKTIQANGSYEFELGARNPATGEANGDVFQAKLAAVKWAIPPQPAGNPAGGPAEIAVTGEMRKKEALPAFEMNVNNDAAAYTV